MNNILNYIPFIIFLALLALLYYSFFVLPLSTQKKVSSKWVQPLPECSENETEACQIGNCSGIRRCKEGRWTTCFIDRICRPGSYEPCFIDPCTIGHKRCNDCGTEYGECVLIVE